MLNTEKSHPIFKKTVLVSLISALLFSPIAFAEAPHREEEQIENRIENHNDIENHDENKPREIMVVTASGFEQDIRDASASISIVTQETLQKQQINDLGDAVKNIEGISVIGTNSNKSDISIRGLPGQYTLILVDGQRVNTRDSRPNGSGGFEAGFMPPVSAIDRIEVVQGPMSSLYGSDAVGGVINVITKKADNEWHGQLSLDSTLQEKSKYGNRYKESLYLSGAAIEDLLFLSLYGKNDKRDEDTFEMGQYGHKNWELGSKITFKPTENQNIHLDIGTNLQKKTYTLGNSNTSDGSIVNRRNHYGISYDAYWNEILTEFSVYQENTKRETSTNSVYAKRKPEIKNTVVDAKVVWPLDRQMLSIGGQYQRNALSDDSVVGSKTSNSGALSSVSLEQTNTVYQKALFVEDEIRVTDDLYATLGLRMDHHSEYGTHYNPRAYLVYNVNENWTIKGGVAKAYKTPSIRESSPNYGTATGGGSAVMYGNANLSPETAVTEEVSFLYENEHQVRGNLTFFNTDFKNKIASESTGTKDPLSGLTLYEYYNIGKATIRGIETGISFPIMESVRLKANYTFLHSKRKTDDGFYSSTNQSLKGEPLAQTPKHKFNARFDWQMKADLSSFIQGTYTGKEIWSDIRNGYGKGARTQSAYTIVDLGLSYNVTKEVQLNGALNNLLNKQLDPTSNGEGDWTSIEGRNLWIGVNIGF